MLQPFDFDPNEKNNHKFMVQSMFAPSGLIEAPEVLVMFPSVAEVLQLLISLNFLVEMDESGKDICVIFFQAKFELCFLGTKPHECKNLI